MKLKSSAYYMAWQRRISIELQQMVKLDIEEHGVMYFPTEDINIGYGLVKGDLNTPYANGFYLIKIIIPPEYPFKPPACWHVSISGARQSPNFHDYHITDDGGGKVCLSRLNTWDGSSPTNDRWSPTMTLISVLNMIRMQVLTAKPLDNEPDYRHSIENPVNAQNYEKFVQYHNIRSNVIDLYRKLKIYKLQIPRDLQDTIAKVIHGYVMKHRDWYLNEIVGRRSDDNGVYVTCTTYTNSSCLCDYDELLADLLNVFIK